MKRPFTCLLLLSLIGLSTTSNLSAGHFIKPTVERFIKSTTGGFTRIAEAPDKGTARGVSVEEEIRNENPAFVVRVDVDHPDRVYMDRELMKVTVVSERAGYLYLLYKQADGSEVCLFPNKIQRDNRIPANRKLTVPAADSDFNLRIGAPFGKETLIALVTLKPLTADKFGAKSLTANDATVVDFDVLIAKGVTVELRNKPTQWAEHHVSITTVVAASAKPTVRKKRFGLFIGISNYDDERIKDLHVCHRDATVMAKLMKDHGDLDVVTVLTEKNGTLANIRAAVKELVAKSNPGDEIFIYWSGHGATCADDNGDEKDGLDEFLVPYDGKTGSLSAIRKSMLLDDTFGRWIQDLDGRRAVVILDTCHSGGLSATTKAIAAPKTYFDFIDTELARTKDIGQKDAAMLCSSDADEVSAERKEGDVSVMTYFLLKRILENGGRRVTLRDAYDYVKVQVPAYIKKNFPGKEQTPIMVNEIGDLYLRR